jgi:hypothetical protein
MSTTSVHGGAAYDGGTPLPEDPLMPDRRALLHQTADLAADYLDSLGTRPVGATATRDELLEAFGGPMPAARRVSCMAGRRSGCWRRATRARS